MSLIKSIYLSFYRFLEIAVGSSHCAAVGRGGDCFVWGDGDAGQLGLGECMLQIHCLNDVDVSYI